MLAYIHACSHRVMIALAEDRFDWYERPAFGGQDQLKLVLEYMKIYEIS